MAKLTYLQMVNRVLTRITQAELSSGVSTATGQAKIISNLINEAQKELWTEGVNWHSLFKQRTFSTVTYTASTIAFNNANPDTITDSANGLGSFSAGQTIVVSGSTSNDGVYVIATAAAGTLTLQTADSLTAEAAGDSVTIYAVSYPVASDWGRTHSLVDFTNNQVLMEEYMRAFVEDDPDMSMYNNPYAFSVMDGFYHLHYIPNGAYKIIDRYWQVPTALSGDSDTTDLPEFCENFLIHWSLMSILDYLQKYDQADRIRLLLYGSPTARDKGILQKCKLSNEKILNKMFRLGGNQAYNAYNYIEAPKLPSTYGRMS